mmetsp:Transcript_8260/g.19403  ORF Transcript_8260/g.19403 Transcript_8260/m.19403 type:complete len:224 (-) Transcript_8260:30-701(-)
MQLQEKALQLRNFCPAFLVRVALVHLLFHGFTGCRRVQTLLEADLALEGGQATTLERAMVEVSLDKVAGLGAELHQLRLRCILHKVVSSDGAASVQEPEELCTHWLTHRGAIPGRATGAKAKLPCTPSPIVEFLFFSLIVFHQARLDQTNASLMGPVFKWRGNSSTRFLSAMLQKARALRALLTGLRLRLTILWACCRGLQEAKAAPQAENASSSDPDHDSRS